MRLRTLLAGLCLAPFACGPRSYLPKEGLSPKRSPWAPVAAAEVEVLRSSRPAFKHEEMSPVTVDGCRPLPELFDLLRAESGRQGAHAVTEVKISSYRLTEDVVERTCEKTGAYGDGGGPTGLRAGLPVRKCRTKTVAKTTMRCKTTGMMVRRKAGP